MLTQKKLKTLTCTLHWFCEKSYEERHIEHLDTLGGRRWVHAVLSTQGFAKEDASEHAQGHWCPWCSRPTVVVWNSPWNSPYITRPGTPAADCLFWIEHDWTHLMVLSVLTNIIYKYSHCEAAPNRLQASPRIGPWIKHIKPVLVLLRPDPRKPEPPKPAFDYTEISWTSWQKAFNLQVSFAATSRGGVIHCE